MQFTYLHFTFIPAEPIIIENGQFSWDSYEGSPSLVDINVEVQPGILVAVVGPVGCGKSSLLSAILGDMYKQSGFVNTHVSRFRHFCGCSAANITLFLSQGTIAYVPQQAWIRNATLKDNITIGDTKNDKFYEEVVEACALNPDFKILPGGDQTEIGEKVSLRYNFYCTLHLYEPCVQFVFFCSLGYQSEWRTEAKNKFSACSFLKIRYLPSG